ncbi:hypothetical protein [Crocosphaera sp.]|uniref:hypothetical protein n=1 Tax=Crocosphaera sp. TaxID=2729996 RepID=UPI00261BE073|nr:hypothetical protein [Crocosphaera sp.]MDJ0580819.1 hypothetical protein [Crocosphaera sp.]
MIESLNKVMTKLEQLPESEQERIAQIILNEVEKQELIVLSSTWKDFFETTPLPSEDFMEKRIDLPPQTREELF